MDPKYTEIEEHVRKKWKAQAQEAQENLLKLKGEAVEREKRERIKAVAHAHAEERARKAVADKAIQDVGLVNALIADLKKLEGLYGIQLTSHSANTSRINDQMTINVQFSRIGTPRHFGSRW